MVDFVKLMTERKAAASKAMAVEKNQPTQIVKAEKTLKERFNHVADEHWDDLNGWEKSFVEDQIEYLRQHPRAEGTPRIREKLKEIENQFCGTGCNHG